MVVGYFFLAATSVVVLGVIWSIMGKQSIPYSVWMLSFMVAAVIALGYSFRFMMELADCLGDFDLCSGTSQESPGWIAIGDAVFSVVAAMFCFISLLLLILLGRAAWRDDQRW